MGRVINWQMAKSGSTSLVPELKFITFTQVCLCPAFLLGKKNNTHTKTKHK